MKDQHNIYQEPHSGGWIVEYRQPGDRQWTRVGVYGSRAVALDAYNTIRKA